MLDREVRALFDGTHYVRQVAASATGLRERIAAVVEQVRAVRKWLPEHERRLLDRLAPLASPDGFKRSCKHANRQYESTKAKNNQAAQQALRQLSTLDREASELFDGTRYVRQVAGPRPGCASASPLPSSWFRRCRSGCQILSVNC